MRFFWQRDKQAHEERHSAFSASSFSASSMALLMVAPAPPAVAAEQAKLTVSATVLKHASLRVLAQPSAVVITAADVARGYVDVAAPAQVAIRSNSPRGYMLEFANAGDFSREIVVKGLTSDLQLSPAGGAIMQPAAPQGVTKTTLQLGFRFVLAASAQPGTYPWPLQLSATPL